MTLVINNIGGSITKRELNNSRSIETFIALHHCATGLHYSALLFDSNFSVFRREKTRRWS
jgi:hypothetical protein